MHRCLQNAAGGKIHRMWEALTDEATARGDHVIQLVIMGSHIVVLATPEAAEVVLKKNAFVPKWAEGYKTFHFLVRLSPLLSPTARSGGAAPMRGHLTRAHIQTMRTEAHSAARRGCVKVDKGKHCFAGLQGRLNPRA